MTAQRAPWLSMVTHLRYGRWLDLGLLAGALAVAGLTAVEFARGYCWTLFADSWTVLMDYQAAGYRVTAPLLLGFHAEHRPAFARLPILLDMRFDGGRGWLPFALMLAALMA